MTFNWRRELRHSWPMLVPARAAEIATCPLNVNFLAGRARIGVDASGFRHLLIPIGIGEMEPGSDDVDGSLLVRISKHSFANRVVRYVDVGCFRSDLNDLFDDVLIDILEAISEDEPDSPGMTAASVVDRWRNLLELRRQRLLTLVAQMSMFGELSTLDLLTEGQAIDVLVWRGPLREVHDLVFPNCSVEVKAIGAASRVVEIHGVQQLEPPLGGTLVLAVVTVVENVDGCTLPELIDRVQERVTDSAEFERRLVAVGYSHSERERFHQRFEIVDFAHLTVGESTPRIVAETFKRRALPPGVDQVVYAISLNALDPLLNRDPNSLRATVMRDGS